LSNDSDALREPGNVYLDGAGGRPGEERSLLFTRPLRTITAAMVDEVIPALRLIDAAVESGLWVAGYIAYEAGAAFGLPVVEPRAPGELLWFGVYEHPEPVALAIDKVPDTAVDNLRFEIDRRRYKEQIARVRDLIREGDVYQVNFTAPIRFRSDTPPAGLFGQIRGRQPVPFGACVNAAAGTLLSFSPEMFFRRRGRMIETRPMKGTIRRGRDPLEDGHLRSLLLADEKSRAENLMIVDLLRNDLSVVCEPGSVVVSDLFSVETYPTLNQMTSTVSGRLRQNTGYLDLFSALFPCGSVTGAPKHRAMQRITELESEPRGAYCGAIGYIGPQDEAVFNVAIRTIRMEGGEGTLGVGSGVVWDSDADAEYDECLLKAQFLAGRRPLEQDFRVFETMRVMPEEGIPLLDGHAGRIEESARHFHIRFDGERFRDAVLQEVSRRPVDEPCVLKALLSPDGSLEFEWRALPPQTVPRVTISPHRVNSGDTGLRHKTNRRQLYQDEYARVTNEGFGEVLFLNEHGRITEGSRSNFIVESRGRRVTPPPDEGLLPGVFRQHLLDTGQIDAEEPVTLDMLQSADRLFICNGIRGLVEVEIPEAIFTGQISL
jgi:para-aminobenzoate synthetase / 4-amino-4-deoxychorismate lyase